MHVNIEPNTGKVSEVSHYTAWGDLGSSLRRAWYNFGTGMTLEALGLTLEGCSPQTKSYYSRAYT